MDVPPWPGINKLYPAKECLVSDSPAGTGKWLNFFYSMLHILGGMISHMGQAKTTNKENRSQIHERTILLRILGIIFSVLRLEVSVWIS
jgi:hypothetical protein